MRAEWPAACCCSHAVEWTAVHGSPMCRHTHMLMSCLPNTCLAVATVAGVPFSGCARALAASTNTITPSWWPRCSSHAPSAQCIHMDHDCSHNPASRPACADLGILGGAGQQSNTCQRSASSKNRSCTIFRYTREHTTPATP